MQKALKADGKRAAKIAALMELQTKVLEIVGKPPLAEADAFEAARDLAHGSGAAGLKNFTETARPPGDPFFDIGDPINTPILGRLFESIVETFPFVHCGYSL